MEAVKAMANSASVGWSRFRWVMWGGAAFLLLLPLIAMQFTTEVDWDETDFIVMGAMLATAAAQMIVTVVALAWGWGAWEPPGTAGILALNAFFAALWLLSGGLFRRSALKQAA